MSDTAPSDAKARCSDCGAGYSQADDGCQQRFDLLLALDHARQEPWGSRHGIAFAVFALQHPSLHTVASRTAAAELLTRVYERAEPLERVVAEFRARMSSRAATSTVAAPAVRGPFTVTIADLGDFPAERYVSDLERWARSTLARLSEGPG